SDTVLRASADRDDDSVAWESRAAVMSAVLPPSSIAAEVLDALSPPDSLAMLAAPVARRVAAAMVVIAVRGKLRRTMSGAFLGGCLERLPTMPNLNRIIQHVRCDVIHTICPICPFLWPAGLQQVSD